MVYSVNKIKDDDREPCNSESDYVSVAIMAKVLEERAKERHLRSNSSYQKCYQCRNRCVINPYYDRTTQTSNPVVTSDDLATLPQDHDLDYIEEQDIFTSSPFNDFQSLKESLPASSSKGRDINHSIDIVSSKPKNQFYTTIKSKHKRHFSNETMII